MREHELMEVLRAQPFQPFRMFVSDGAAYVVRHPDLVLVTPTSAIVGASRADQPGPAIDRFNIVDMSHITRLEQIETTTSESAS